MFLLSKWLDLPAMGRCIVSFRRRERQMQTDTRQENQQHVFSQPEGLTTISQVAHLTGINAKAIRYYESIGLLPRPLRGENQYRRYSMVDVNRLNLLRRIRLLGVPLSTAKSLLIG